MSLEEGLSPKVNEGTPQTLDNLENGRRPRVDSSVPATLIAFTLHFENIELLTAITSADQNPLIQPHEAELENAYHGLAEEIKHLFWSLFRAFQLCPSRQTALS